MHTNKYGDWTVLRNGDFSDDVELVSPSGERFWVPFSVLVSLVADWARDVRIAELEGATDREVLGLPR